LGALLLLFAATFASDRAQAANSDAAMLQSDIFSAPGTGLSSTGKPPFLTILYTAMTHGELHPCPT